MNMSVNIISRILWKAKIFIVALFIFGWMTSSFAQDIKVDVNVLLQETLKTSESADDMVLVWWIPEEYWRVSFALDSTITEPETEEFLKVIRPYTVIVIVDGKIGLFGGVTYKSEAGIRASIQIIDNQNISYRPLSEDKIDANTKNFLSMMKPVFSNMMGPMGENTRFFLFPSKNKAGQSIAAAKKEGTFSVKLDKREFKWKLPLSSLLTPKVCPVDGETLSGAWKFCPWHGVELK